MVSILLAAAVIGVIVVRRFNRIVGSVLAILMASGIGVWGYLAYRAGEQIAFAGHPLPRGIFLAIIGTWLILEILSLTQAMRTRHGAGELDDTAD